MGQCSCFGKHWCKALLFSFSTLGLFPCLAVIGHQANLWLGDRRWHRLNANINANTHTRTHKRIRAVSVPVKRKQIVAWQSTKPYGETWRATICNLYLTRSPNILFIWVQHVWHHASFTCVQGCHYNLCEWSQSHLQIIWFNQHEEKRRFGLRWQQL